MKDQPDRRLIEAVSVRVLDVVESKGKKPRIEAVLIASGMSLNRNRYPADVLRPAAPLYEGAKVMLDHADGWTIPETVRNIAAIITSARWDEDTEAIVGTIVPATELESGRVLLDLARAQLAFRKDGTLADAQSLFGFSHRARVTGEYREPDDGDPYYEVESVIEVLSVDAVVHPAAGGVMTSLGEERRESVLARLRESGITPSEPAPPPKAPEDRAPARRKVTIMSKRNSRTFDTGGIVVQVEGVERASLEPVLQAAAQVGFDEATEASAARIATLEADQARAEGERDAALARLATFEEKERAEQQLRDLDALMESKGIPEAARPALRQKVADKGLSAEHAEAVIDAYADGLQSRREGVVEDRDVGTRTQNADVDSLAESKRVADAFYEQQFPAARDAQN